MKIALFGGSFNPIHIGHLWMANAALQYAGADQVLFMPTGDAPHKGQMLDGDTRYAMVKKAIKGTPQYALSDYEIKTPGKSYTIKTLEHLQKGDDTFGLLIGEDSFLQIHTWYEYEELITRVPLWVVPRHTDISLSVQSQYARLTALGATIQFLPMGRIEISSTDIRRRVRFHQPIRAMVPKDVEAYIHENQLYRDAHADQMIQGLQEDIAPKRMAHILRVAYWMDELAKQHGIDEKETMEAALLHDSAKGIEKKLLDDSWYSERFTMQDEDKALWHEELGMLRAQKKYGVTNEDVLRAIRVHTTGAHPMQPLDKLLYIADKTEPGRPGPKNIALRRLAKDDLDEAFYQTMQESIHYIETNQQQVHPWTHELNMKEKERRIDQNSGTGTSSH